jgi:hypothetical protein
MEKYQTTKLTLLILFFKVLRYQHDPHERSATVCVVRYNHFNYIIIVNDLIIILYRFFYFAGKPVDAMQHKI